MIKERFELIKERLQNVNVREEISVEYAPFFEEIFIFLNKVLINYEFVKNGEIYVYSIEELAKRNA